MHVLNGMVFDLEKHSTLHIDLAKSNPKSKRSRTDDGRESLKKTKSWSNTPESVIAGDTLVMRMTLLKFQKRFGLAKMEFSPSSSSLPLSRINSATTTKLSLLLPPFSSSSTYLASAETLLRLRLKATQSVALC
ncbi:hypothetical protein HA466_0297760 [Hirschfeldia incana]|nr:hypothetical protein HA466_0297760 [Hirschfeldia incana]